MRLLCGLPVLFGPPVCGGVPRSAAKAMKAGRPLRTGLVSLAEPGGLRWCAPRRLGDAWTQTQCQYSDIKKGMSEYCYGSRGGRSRLEV